MGVRSIKWVGLPDLGKGRAPGLGQRSGSWTRAKVRLPDSGKGRAPGLRQRSGSQTQAKVGVLLVLSSPLANWLKARASAGWSSDIMMEVLGESSIAITGSPSVSAGVLPTSAEFQVWRGFRPQAQSSKFGRGFARECRVPSLAGVSPASAEFQVWQGGMTIQGGQFEYTVKCWDSSSMGMKGYVKEGLELTPMGSFNIGQGGCQLRT